MSVLSPYRDAELVRNIADEIAALRLSRPIRLMEVCGGHTAAIYRFALPDFLPQEVKLLSGPGCPVCVTANDFIDRAVALSFLPHVTVATFGDLIGLPGSSRSLADARAAGGSVEVFYSSADALQWASSHPDNAVVFLGIGFETTACTLAATALEAVKNGVKNFCMLLAAKTMPAAMKTLISTPGASIDGFILPGHVTTVTGMGIFKFIAEEYHIPCVVSGFEPADLMESILMLCRQIKDGRAVVENQYSRVVHESGNAAAQSVIERMFEPCDMHWRGFGMIPMSGLKLRNEYSDWDAAYIPVEVEPMREHPGCRCGEVLRGIIGPRDCGLFGSVCTPDSPKGACMVSAEGACAAVYHFAQ